MKSGSELPPFERSQPSMVTFSEELIRRVAEAVERRRSDLGVRERESRKASIQEAARENGVSIFSMPADSRTDFMSRVSMTLSDMKVQKILKGFPPISSPHSAGSHSSWIDKYYGNPDDPSGNGEK